MSRRRAAALGLALLTLPGLFILGGADLPFPYSHELGPDDETLDSEYDEYIGTDIATSGTVIDADERLVRIDHDTGSLVVTLNIHDHHDATLQEGDHVSVSGTIEADHTITVTEDHHIWIRAPWEVHYMYGISLIGALFTALLVANYWRFDWSHYHLVPRKEPIVAILRTGDSNG